MQSILEVKNLSKRFFLHEQQREIRSCENISFTLNKGKFIGIVGTSGAGKSTVLRSIYRTYLASSGDVFYNSLAFGTINLNDADEQKIIYLRRAEIGYVSQFLATLPRTTARELVENAAMEAEFSKEEAGKKAEEMLSYFKLPQSLWDLYPTTFSGGEKLRLNLAHAMVKAPRLLLLDEPTASLDNDTKRLVRDLLLKLKTDGTSMIGIFHDLEFMDGLCDEIFNISKGKIESEETL